MKYIIYIMFIVILLSSAYADNTIIENELSYVENHNGYVSQIPYKISSGENAILNITTDFGKKIDICIRFERITKVEVKINKLKVSKYSANYYCTKNFKEKDKYNLTFIYNGISPVKYDVVVIPTDYNLNIDLAIVENNSIILDPILVGVPMINMTFDDSDGTYSSTIAENLGSDNSNMTVNNNPSHSNSYFGQAYTFNGIDTYLNASSRYIFSENLTVAFWINQVNSNNGFILSYTNTSDTNNRFQILKAGDKIRALVSNSSNGGAIAKEYQTTSSLITGTWAHVIISYNKTNLTIYINGAANTVTKLSDGVVRLTNISRDIALGVNNNNPVLATYLNARIDELLFYNEPINSTQANDLYLSYNQTFLGLFSCSSRGNKTLTINVYNQTSGADLSVPIEGNFVYDINDTETNKTFGFSETTNKYEICLFPDTINATTSIHIESILGNSYFNYFTQSLNLNVSPKTLNLYLIDGTTTYVINIKDKQGNNLPNTYIDIQAYDVGSNTYRSIEVLKTDNQGNAVANIALFTTFYRFVFTYDGIVRLIDGPTKITQSTQNYEIDILANDYFDNLRSYRDITYNLTFNNATRNFKLTYNDVQQVTKSIHLKVEHINVSGNVVKILVNSTAKSGQLLGNIGANISNQKYIATAYVKFPDDTIFVLDILEQSFTNEHLLWEDKESKSGIFVTMILVLTLILLGASHPIPAIVLGLVGMTVSFVIGFYYVSWVTMVTLFVIGGIAVWRINKIK